MTPHQAAHKRRLFVRRIRRRGRTPNSLWFQQLSPRERLPSTHGDRRRIDRLMAFWESAW